MARRPSGLRGSSKIKKKKKGDRNQTIDQWKMGRVYKDIIKNTGVTGRNGEFILNISLQTRFNNIV